MTQMIFIQTYQTKKGGETDGSGVVIADSLVKLAQEREAETEGYQPGEVEQQLILSFLFTEFKDIVESGCEGLLVCDSAKDMVRELEEREGAQKLIGFLNDPEDACKEYLESKGYFIAADREDAIEELKEEAAVEIAGNDALHSQYAGDTIDKVREIASSHGWLAVLDTLNEKF